MTSKEAFERIKDFLGSNYCYELRDEIKIVDDAIDRLEDYDIIFNTPIKSLRKDLEVLEILKNHFYSSGKDYENYDFFTFEINGETEECKLVKEWLDEK